MTRQFNKYIDCPNCGVSITMQDGFGRWIMQNKRLDAAREGIVVIDIDYIIHRYKRYQSREFQCLMVVEVKQYGAEPSKAQKDTLHLLNQALRNRRSTPTKKNHRLQLDHPAITKAHSLLRDCETTLRMFGAHLLQFSGTGPADSDLIKWHGNPIDENTLTELLAFNLDPDSLRPIDFRSHHRSENWPTPLFNYQ